MRAEQPRRVVVVGGGITGLAAAHALQERTLGGLPIDVTLLEASPRLGGKILTERVDGFTVEGGPDSFLTSKPAAVDLCTRLGLGDRFLTSNQDARIVYVLHRGRLHPLPEGLALVVPLRLLPVLRSRLFSPWEKLRMGLDLLLPPAPAREDESLGSLMRRRFGHAAVARLAGPLLGGIYAGDVDRLSVRATFPYLADMERRHGSLIAGMRAQRSGGMAAGNSRPPMFLTLRGGVGVLVDRLTASLTATTILTARPVRAIARTDHANPRNGYTVHLDGGVLRADALILATPAPAAADLLTEVSPQAATLLRQIPYVSTAVVALGYRRSAVVSPMRGHGFVVARGEEVRISACTWASSKWPGCAPPDHVLLRCYLGTAGDESASDLDEDALISLVRHELRTTMGIAAEPALVRVYRWQAAMPQYLVGHLRRLEAIEAAMASAPGIALAGAAYRGVGIPDCVRQGIEAAARVADHLQILSPPDCRPLFSSPTLRVGD